MDGLTEQEIKYKFETSGDFQTDIDIIYPISFNQNVYISLVREQDQNNSGKVYIYAKKVTLSEAKITTRVNDFGNFYLKLSGN